MAIREENIRLIFGLKLRQLRLDKQLSLAELSARTGVSISYLNEIEKGKKYPKADKIVALADALQVSYDWMVSLQLSKNLAPIAELLHSEILSELPLDVFGIEPADLLELLSNAPVKLSAFVSTLFEISRNYDMRVEQFYFSVLRSFQEMYENYFEDIEAEVDRFIATHQLSQQVLTDEILAEVLINNYNYSIDYDGLASKPQLQSLRSVLLQNGAPRLLLNKNLNPRQKAFTLSREIGYQFMQLKDRPYTFSWVEVNSFEQVLNNFKASYFASALLIRKEPLIQDLEIFFNSPQWDGEQLVDMMEKYNATPEMFLHRLSNILPRFFGMNELFFLRFNNTAGVDEYFLTKEMHLSGLHNPHATVLNEHYCRRWVSLTILKRLAEQQAAQQYIRPICDAQRSKYIDSNREYLVISIARPMAPTPNLNSSVSIGLLVNDTLKKKVKFWNDSNLPIRTVFETCERCPAANCMERVAPPVILQKQQKTELMKESLRELTQQVSASEAVNEA